MKYENGLGFSVIGIIPIFMYLDALAYGVQHWKIQFAALAFAVRMVLLVELNGTGNFCVLRNFITGIAQGPDFVEPAPAL
jgi:hypothetical protein